MRETALFDARDLRVRSAGKVVSVPVLTAVGVLADGEKQLLALELCRAESADAWAGFVDAPTGPGLKAPLLRIIDGKAGLRRAVGSAWPQAAVHRCCVHKLRHLKRKAPKHALAELRDDFHRIVYAAQWRECPGCVHRLRAQVEQALSWGRAKARRGGRRAAHLFPLPQGAVEDAADDERH